MARSWLVRLRDRLTSPWEVRLTDIHVGAVIPLEEAGEIQATTRVIQSELEQESFLPHRCDWPNCDRLPFVEVYPADGSGWSYLCRWHFYFDRLRFTIRIRAYPNLWCSAT